MVITSDSGDNGAPATPQQQLFPVPREMPGVFVRNLSTTPSEGIKPTIEAIEGKRYLAFRRQPDSAGPQSGALELFPIGDEVLNAAQMEKLQDLLGEDFKDVVRDGLCKGLENIDDPIIQAIFLSMLTRFNPRQVAILLFLYRQAHKSQSGPTLRFSCNDLLNALYTPSNRKDGWPSNVRGLVNKDLWDLNDIKFDVPDPDCDPDQPYMITRAIVSILTIVKYHVDKRNFRVDEQTFDWKQLGYPITRMPDGYTVTLTFYKSSREGGYLLLPMDINLKQPDSVPTGRNYKSKLLTLLMAEMAKGQHAGHQQCFHFGQEELFNRLGLNGKNVSRKTSTIKRAGHQLLTENLLSDFSEIREQGGTLVFRFVPNPSHIRYVP